MGHKRCQALKKTRVLLNIHWSQTMSSFKEDKCIVKYTWVTNDVNLERRQVYC